MTTPNRIKFRGATYIKDDEIPTNKEEAVRLVLKKMGEMRGYAEAYIKEVGAGAPSSVHAIQKLNEYWSAGVVAMGMLQHSIKYDD